MYTIASKDTTIIMILKIRLNWQKKDVSLEGHAIKMPEDPLAPIPPNNALPTAPELVDPRNNSIF